MKRQASVPQADTILAQAPVRRAVTACVMFLVLTLIPLLATTAGPTPSLASAATLPPKEATHCVVVIAAGTAEDRAAKRPSKVLKQECFATVGEKNEALEGLSGEFGTQSLYLLLKLWDYTWRGGASYELYSPSGCGGYYNIPDLGTSGWDNAAESAEPFCGRTFRLFENPWLDYSAAVRPLDYFVPDLGALNNNVSSLETSN